MHNPPDLIKLALYAADSRVGLLCRECRIDTEISRCLLAQEYGLAQQLGALKLIARAA